MALTKVHNRMIDGAAANVMDYGAVGNGTTDDTAAIQAAINSGNKNIYFPPDYDFLVKTRVSILTDDVTLSGYGSTVITEDDIAAGSSVFFVDANRFSMFGLTIDGQVVAGQFALCDAIFINAGVGCTIQDCRIQNFDNGAGIALRSFGSNHIIKDNFIKNCTPVAAGGLQYGSIMCNASGTLVTGNRITKHKQTAISNAGGDYITITDNYMAGAAGVGDVGGIIFDGLTIGGVMDGNTIYTGDVEAIQIAGGIALYGGPSKDHVISNNVIINSDYSAITLFALDFGAVTQVTISGNHISNSSSTAGRAFEMNRASKILINGNYVIGHNRGTEIPNAVTDVNITGNFFYNQDNIAIMVYGNKWLVSGNKVIGDGNSTIGIQFNGVTIAGDQLIHGNQISECATGIVGTFNASLPTFVYNNHFLDNTTDYSWTNRGVNSAQDNVFDVTLSGEVTLTAGTASVAFASLAADDLIEFYLKTNGGTEGALYISNKNAGVGFDVASTSATDTSTYYWRVNR